MAQRGTVIRRILGCKLQKVVDGQVADRLDRDGNVQRYWTLFFDLLTQRGLAERKVNVFPNHFSGGRNGESMFWTRQGLRGLVSLIKSVQPGQEEVLAEPITAVVEYEGKWWSLRDVGRSLNEAAAPASAQAPTPAHAPALEKRIDQMDSDLGNILELLQQLLNKQQLAG